MDFTAAQTIIIDRRRSGNTSFSRAFASIETIQLNAPEGKIKLRVLMDKSVVEVFVNDGDYALTDQVFPVKNGGGIDFFSKNGKASFSNVNINRVRKTIH